MRPFARRPARRLHEPWDVVVVGGGLAGLSAAITARELGCSVLVLERAPRELRGGNTRHARNLRCVQLKTSAYNTGSYSSEQFIDDLRRACADLCDETLALMTVSDSAELPGWLSAHGVQWQRALDSAVALGHTNRLLLGGGKALVNTCHRAFARLGGTVLYGATVEDLLIEDDRLTAVAMRIDGCAQRIGARAVVCASGGRTADPEWLRRQWGAASARCVVRGVPYNDGGVQRLLYAHGAAAVGHDDGFHAVPVDARSPRFDGGIAVRVAALSFALLLDQDGRRFCDEGAVPPRRFAAWGRKLSGLPGLTAHAIWDRKVADQVRPSMFKPYACGTVADLARTLGLDAMTVVATVTRYNAAMRTGAGDRWARAEQLRTVGLDPPKSSWALPIDTPPFYGVALQSGITFAHRGVAVDGSARVLRVHGSAFRNVFAAGEIMAGNVLPSGYLSGLGLTIAGVWGRIAGRSAARACS